MSDSGESGGGPTSSNTQPAPSSRVKHDWYQTETHIIITVLLKNAPKDKIIIQFNDRHFSFSCPIPDSPSDYILELDLQHAVVPEQCSHVVSASKVEVKLKKRDGLRWTKLEGEEDEAKPIPKTLQATEQKPAYPSSSPAHRDWDKIEKEITKQEEQEKPEGEEALKKLFEQIYGLGSDEVKKAMNKSYVESKGTVLSTNWNEVSKDKVEIKPPDGIEFKEWGS